VGCPFSPWNGFGNAADDVPDRIAKLDPLYSRLHRRREPPKSGSVESLSRKRSSLDPEARSGPDFLSLESVPQARIF